MDTQGNPIPEGEEDKDPLTFLFDMTRVPCFRESMLYGVVSGTGFGLHSFYKTGSGVFDRALLAFIGVAGVSWGICRYKYKLKRDEFITLMTLQENASKIRKAVQEDQQAETGSDEASQLS